MHREGGGARGELRGRLSRRVEIVRKTGRPCPPVGSVGVLPRDYPRLPEITRDYKDRKGGDLFLFTHLSLPAFPNIYLCI